MDTYPMASEIVNQKSLYLSPPPASGSADGTMNSFLLENYHDEKCRSPMNEATLKQELLTFFRSCPCGTSKVLTPAFPSLILN